MKVISFFSYKGGAGRSTVAYNTIPILAKDFIHPTAEHPMIVLDTDIDSCGMTYLLDKPSNRIEATDENCVQTLLAQSCDPVRTDTIQEHPFLGKLCPVGKAFGCEDNNAILLVPAKGGKRIDDDGIANYEVGDNPLIRNMQSFIECCDRMGVSTIFFDSAVGDNLSAIISNENADIIVCCMRPTRQFRDGTAKYLRRIENNRISGGKEIIIVPNVIPQDELVIDNQLYPGEALYHIKNAFSPFVQNSMHNYHLDFLSADNFGIPALDRFMWCEEILRNLNTLTPEEELVLSRYTMLADIINNIDT